MPTKKARGKSKASRATGKTKRSARKSTRKKSAAKGAQPTSLKKKVRRLSPGVVKSMKDMAGAVMAAAAAGALKGAVTAVLPPVRKAAGVTEEGRETKGPGEAPRSQDQREIRQNDTT